MSKSILSLLKNGYLKLLLLMLFAPVSYGDNRKETYFGCQNGFQFESKLSAARCIKQERISFRSPEPCMKKGNKYRTFKLKIDSQGKNDMCLDWRKEVNKPNSLRSTNAYKPICISGFKLQIQHGKDTCTQDNPETIKAPNRKVIQ